MEVQAQRKAEGEAKEKKAELKDYKKVAGIAGKVTVVGSDTLLNLMEGWKNDFTGYYKNTSFEIEGKGSSTAPPALLEGRSDLGPMSRAMKATEEKTFEDKFGYKPTAVPVALDALAVFVNKDNPIKGLNLKQVDAMFSQTRKRGAATEATKWGDVGLSEGNWANTNITLYGRNTASGTYAYFKEVALKKGDYSAKVNQMPGSAGVVQKISGELGAIGYSGLGYSTAGVKATPLAADDGTDFKAANAE
ncbi:MAG: PstS family phosphate ABC transporter substrate-binding protein, partial [Planctomycetes bacterium]|nr:PstS family phosphate ABC transporter substrate-binding protein [Planctomycetota bacterium]